MDEIDSIKKACKLLGVPSTGFYEYWGCRKSNAQIEREAFEGFAIDVLKRYKSRYRYRRINRELHESGIVVGEKRVLHIMQKLGLPSKGANRKCMAQKKEESGNLRLNLVERVSAANERNRLWVGNITYIPINEGWLYLGAIIDTFSRNVVGWSMSERIIEKVASDAIEQAMGRENPSNDGTLVSHGDQGVQHTFRSLQYCLDSHGIVSRYQDPARHWIMRWHIPSSIH